MEVITLNSTNYIGLSTVYGPDSSLKFDQDVYYTEQGIGFPLSRALLNPNDSTTNNYSNLFLTQSVPLVSSVYIEDLEHIPDDGFTTYLAVNSIDGIEEAVSKFLVVEEPDFYTSNAATALTGVYSQMDNRYFFTIKFHSDDLCRVEHVNENIVRYLTIGADGNFYFTFDTGTDYLNEYSPQLFNYLYDRDGGYIILSKNLQDIPHYIAYYSTKSPYITAIPAVSGFPSYPAGAIFTCVDRPVQPNNTVLCDPWVSYQKDFKTNTQNINIEGTTENINSNMLLHSQYLALTGGTLSVNALSLKNTNTPENFQSRNNPFQAGKSQFLSEDDIEMRDYKKLFTGSNQLLGSDNITLGYESYTTDIVLKKDKITYFHVPQTLYPYARLNINDSGLVQAGAIAGDHPVKSDKIFKKLADAKDTSPFGSASDETNGTFLCSWLSGGIDVNAPPIWVDRYYDPSKVTFIDALTSRTLNAITYTTVFDEIVKSAGYTPNTDDVFDKQSDLAFEPGTYYAYHHYGPTDVRKYIKSFAPYLVEEDFPHYFYANGSQIITGQVPEAEYTFDGNRYAVTNALSSIQDSNQFTLSFDMYNQDWTKPFAHQLIGNLLSDGFGIFNENIVTPRIFVNSISGLEILNTDFKKINTVAYPTSALAFIRPRFSENYLVACADGYLRQYTCDDRLLRQNFSPYLSSIVSFSNTDDTAFLLCSTPTISRLLSACPGTNTLAPVVTSIISSRCHTSYSNSAGYPLLSTGTVNYYKNNFYFTSGTVSKRKDNTIYYLTDNNNTINKWDINSTNNAVTTAFRANTGTNGFADFNIDFDGNIWILNNKNIFYKFTQNSQFLLSGALTSKTPITTVLNITGNGTTRYYPITAQTPLTPSDLNIIINNTVQRPVFDYSLSASKVLFVNPPLSGYTGTIQYTQSLDTFNNSKVSFISDFTNSVYTSNVLFARTGATINSTTSGISALSSPAYQFLVYDTQGNQLSSTFYFTATGKPALANIDYLREYALPTYPQPNLNIKIVTTNISDNTDVSMNEIIYNLSALDPGYHNFVIRFDSYHGYMSLFIDSQLVQSLQFTPRKYKFSNLINRPFLVGSSCVSNSLPLFKYLQKQSFLAENIKIKNFYLYNTPLNDCDVAMHAKKNANIQDIHFDVPCGRRNYLEEIERYFKATLPGSKSTQYNINIRNTGITDPKLQAALEARIAIILANSAPVYTKLNKIKWIN